MDLTDLVLQFSACLQDPASAQRRTLDQVIRNGASSPFGLAHEFDRLKTVDDFRHAVPLSTFEDLRPWLEATPSGLTNERPEAFLSTSGSTGRPKLIPYVPAFRDSIRVAHDVFTGAMFRDHPALPLVRGRSPRAIGLYQRSAFNTRFHEVPLDSYVSRLYGVAQPTDPFFFGLPAALCGVSDARERLYAMLLVASGWDLYAIRATNPTTLLLFARILAEETEALLGDLASGEPLSMPALAGALAGQLVAQPALAKRLRGVGRPLRPTDLWPNLRLLVTWRGGVCWRYEPHLKEVFGEVAIRAPIFAASEGVVAIPLDDAMRGGVLALSSSFFEFLEEDADHTETRLAHELELGRRYELVFTAPSGMYRYRIGDLVEVDGQVGACPTVTFVARKGRSSSITGEKLTEHQVDEAMAAASVDVGASPVHFLLSAQFAQLPYYVLSTEWRVDPDPDVSRRLVASFDAHLARINLEYQAKRASDRLAAVVLREVRTGEFERLQARGLSGGQAANFKLPRLSAEPLHEQLAPLER